VPNDASGAPTCHSGELLAERRDIEAGHTRAVPRGKKFLCSLITDVPPLVLEATTSAKAVHE
jgi:hypothetical protein